MSYSQREKKIHILHVFPLARRTYIFQHKGEKKEEEMHLLAGKANRSKDIGDRFITHQHLLEKERGGLGPLQSRRAYGTWELVWTAKA